MKFSMKRLAALVLALVMVIGLVPVMNNVANAVDVTGLIDDTIGVTYTTAGQPNANTSGWTADMNTLSGTVQGITRGTGKNVVYMAAKHTVTITNNRTGDATLSFDYEVTLTNGGSVTIDGETVTSGSKSKELAAGESVSIVVSADRTTGSKDNKITVSITNISLVNAGNTAVTTTFEAPAYGSYTVAYGEAAPLTVAAGTASQSASNLPSVKYTLTANPGEGYKFLGWYNVTTGKYLSTTAVYEASFDATATVKAVIVPEDNAVFLVGANYYTDDLNNAVAYAQANSLTQITQVQSGILPKCDGGYTIPAGITLLIPMDTEYTVTTTDDKDFGVMAEHTIEQTTPTAYMVLTMAEGVELVVNGTLDIEATYTSLQGGKTTGGRPSGNYAAIYTSPESKITVNDGGVLFAWGYIYGEGTVTANSGANVYEFMQVTDFPGGSNMALFVDTDPTFDVDGDGNPTNDYIKTFPFSQYYVQNIEVELTLNKGASESVFIAMTAGGQTMGLPVKFIGEGGMFNPGSGSIVKDYDPSTDRLDVSVNGDATMAGIALDLTGTDYESVVQNQIGTPKVDSATFVLCLNSNITININSGTTTIKQDLHLLPGVEINVAEDATLIIAQRTFADGEYDNLTIYQSGGYNVYIWDLENWGKYVFGSKYLAPVSYSPTSGRYTRKYADLKDVVIDINGTVVCDGFIYTTATMDEDTWEALSGGASIISTGKTGKLVMQSGAGIEEFAFCLDGTSSADNVTTIVSAWLQNGDKSYLQTAGAEAGTTYLYCEGHDCWYTEGHKDRTVEITWIINGVGGPEEYTICSIPSYKGSTPTKPANGCTVYTFAGWSTTDGGKVLTQMPVVEADATYFAVFTESIVHVGDDDKDHYCDGCDMGPTECVDENQDHLCDFAGCQDELSDCADANADHKCDYVGCQATVSSCKDDNADHKCDYAGCQATVSSCKDDSQDHKCDYAGCQATMSSCKDDNNDHLCDYAGCKAKLTSCKDDNADHKCDYTGCQATLSDCADADADHVCDAEGCKATVSSCKDDNADHKCDYAGCQATVSSCADDNKDHKCDYAGCQATMSSCKDDNNDHLCDYTGCKDELSDCKDDNADHKCDYAGCQDKLSDCADADADHICDYAGCKATVSSCKDDNADHKCDYAGCQATVSSCKDDNEDHYCDYSGCGDKLSNCEDGDDKDHNCDYEGCQAENVDGGHHGGTAYCNAKKVCAECGQEYGSVDGSNHAYSESTYWGDITETTHTIYYSCCGGVKVTEPHKYVSGICGCNAKQSFTITWIVDGVTTTETYKTGDVPSFKGSTDKAANGCTVYTFKGWDKDIVAVTGNVTYTAQYTESKNHSWDDATCTAPKTCSVCGDTDGEALGHSWNAADCDTPKTCSVCGDTEGEALGHSWNAADCDTARTCSVCGETDGEALGHSWNAADCDTPKTCSVCGDTEGEALGHSWNAADCDTAKTCSVCGETEGEALGHSWNAADCDTPKTCSVCGDTEGNALGHSGGEATCQAKAVCGVCGQEYGELNADNHVSADVVYDNVTKTTHDEYYACCPTVLKKDNAPHDYTDDAWNHKCDCGAVEEFKLTVVYGVNGEFTYEAMVPYWTPMDELDVINNIPWTIYVNDATHLGHYDLDDFCWDMDGDGELDRDRYFTEGCMPAHDLYVEVRYIFTGFAHDGNGWQIMNYGYMPKNEVMMFGMSDLYENGSEEELEGIYMADANGYRIENGLGRFYYMGYNPFSGITYEPNAEDIAYYENKGLTFIDKEMTWYYFGADGKLAENYTGLVGNSYVVNGQAAWHVGLVEIDGDYYYFKGDEVNGGNIMVTGCDYYVSRNKSDFAMVVGGLYTFDNDGVMQLFHGIEESELFEGKRYYVGGQLMVGAGLVDLYTVDTGVTNYFYVNAYGNLIVDAEYYIGANELGIKKGIYSFDSNGFLVIPEEEPGKEGLHFEDGKWYYYVDGAKAYCAGLTEIDGNWVYVKSDGSLATGVYYVTNTNGNEYIASGTKCTFDENGVLIDPVIYIEVLDEGSATVDTFEWATDYVFAFTPDKDGKLTIEVSNIVLDGEYENVGFCVDVWAADYGWLDENFVLDGSMEYNVSADMGECLVFIYPAYETEDYYELVSGSFDYKISLGADGSPKNGIIDGYYYVDGHIAYAAGLIEIDGNYYYVRSNGQIVTDCQYWITNVNDTGYEPGMYEFDEDGCMSEIYVETFTGVKDGYYYIDDEIAYNAGLMNYNGGYIYVRSNGQIATGKYWITNHNGLLSEGFYDFGDNGIYYPDAPEGALLVKNVVKNTETDGFGGYYGSAEAIIPQEDGILYIQVTDITYAEEVLNDKGFRIDVESSDYWERELSAQAVGPQTISIPVKAGIDYILFVNPADLDAEDYTLINGTITYKIWSTVDFELEEVSVGQ